jgi:hypothetical protein
MRFWLMCVVLAVASTGLAPALAAQGRERELGSGCAANRPAIAHYAGGVTLAAPQGEEPPIPCVMVTGYHTGEISIAVTNAGTALFQPAWKTETTSTPIVRVGQVGPPIPLIRSVDQGASWNPPQTTPNDADMWVDRRTGRVFWMVFGIPHSPPPFPGGSHLEISDDDGKTWLPGGAPLSVDHPAMFGGPPTAKAKHLMKGYPNVVYVCLGHVPLKCQKSLDGGMTWGRELDIPYPPGLETIQ